MSNIPLFICTILFLLMKDYCMCSFIFEDTFNTEKEKCQVNEKNIRRYINELTLEIQKNHDRLITKNLNAIRSIVKDHQDVLVAFSQQIDKSWDETTWLDSIIFYVYVYGIVILMTNNTNFTICTEFPITSILIMGVMIELLLNFITYLVGVHLFKCHSHVWFIRYVLLFASISTFLYTTCARIWSDMRSEIKNLLSSHRTITLWHLLFPNFFKD